MKLPSWREFTRKESAFEKEAVAKIAQFKDNHPMLGSAVEGLFSSLPGPFGAIASNIYADAAGSEDEKSEKVLDYFKELKSLGEDHYLQIQSKLNELTTRIGDMGQVMAKESTVRKIGELLVSSGKATEEKLNQLENELAQLGMTVDTIRVTSEETLVVAKRSLKWDEEFDTRLKRLETLLSPIPEAPYRGGVPPTSPASPAEEEHRISPEQLAEIQMLKAKVLELGRQVEFDYVILLKDANAYYLAGEYRQAMEHYDFILGSRSNDVLVLCNMGAAFHCLGEYDEAIRWYNKALEIDSKYVDALYNKGNSLSAQGKFEEADTWYERALKISPKQPDVMTNKGYSLAMRGDYANAIIWFSKALEIEPKDVDALYLTGNSLAALGALDESIAWYEKALKINSKDTRVLYNRGLAFQKMYLLEDAIASFEMALEANPKHISSLTNMGVCLGALGSLDKALECYNKALDVDQKHVAALYNKARTLGMLHRNDESLKTLGLALYLDAGLKDRVMHDPAFADLHNDSRFQMLASP